MSKWAALAGSNGGMAVSAVAVAAVAIGAGVYVSSRNTEVTPVAQPVAEAVQTPTEDVAVQPAPTPTPDPEPEVVAEVAEAPEPPSIDEVRLEADGLTIIAGRAAPGSEVSVLLDGAKNTSVTTDAGGSFAAITILPPSAKAQVLTVVQRVGEDEIASVDEIILAPQAQVVVEADPVPEPAAPVDEDPDAPVVAEAAPEVDDDANTPEVEEIARVEDRAPEPVAEPVATQDATPKVATVAEPEPEDAGEDAEIVVAEVEPEPVVPEPVKVEPANPEPVEIVEAAPEAPQPAETAPEAPAPQVAAIASPEPEINEPTASETPEVIPEPPQPASRQVTVLKSTEDGVELLNTASPQVLENIELDTISYSQTGDVQLAGRAQEEAEVVRIYVNNRPVVDLGVDADGRWQGDLPQIDTGVYTLRVDELDSEGKVTSRVETPFRREDPAVLAEIDDPSASAKQITVQAGNTLWGIARDRYGEGRLFVQVFEANRDRIRNADLIFPGQVFALPE